MKRVGVYAGTFDPIHAGHVAFAEKALKDCQLDKIFFLVEPRPRRKQGVRALEHREAMLRLAISDHKAFGMILLEQANFSVESTLPKLQALFEGAKIYMLLGEDVFAHMNSWPHVERLLKTVRFIVGIRVGDETKVKQYLQTVEKTRGIQFKTIFLVTEHQSVSSSKIRLSLKRNQQPQGLLPKTQEYIQQHGLYGPTDQTLAQD